MKHFALVAVKLAVGVALLAYLFSITDTAALEQRLRSADPLLLAAAVACYFTMVALATWRWQLLLETLGVDAPLRRLGSPPPGAAVFHHILPPHNRRAAPP